MLTNSSTFGFNYWRWQNLTNAICKCPWSRGVAAAFSWVRTYSQNPESIFTDFIHRQGVQRNCWNSDVRAARGLQRGNTTNAPKPSPGGLRGTLRKPLLFSEWFIFHSAMGRISALQGTELCKRQQMQSPFPTEMKNKYQHLFSSSNDAQGCYV